MSDSHKLKRFQNLAEYGTDDWTANKEKYDLDVKPSVTVESSTSNFQNLAEYGMDDWSQLKKNTI